MPAPMQGTPESMSRKALKDLPQCTPDTCPLKVAHPKNGNEFVLGECFWMIDMR